MPRMSTSTIRKIGSSGDGLDAKPPCYRERVLTLPAHGAYGIMRPFMPGMLRSAFTSPEVSMSSLSARRMSRWRALP